MEVWCIACVVDTEFLNEVQNSVLWRIKYLLEDHLLYYEYCENYVRLEVFMAIMIHEVYSLLGSSAM
jgi:hypothetical protein